jgi:ElaB/YqjD/DUF883 family membrane-anchored ribosome-binding protein
MSIFDTTKDAERKLEKTKANNAANLDNEIAAGIHDVKENVVGLVRNVRDASSERTHAAGDYVRDRMVDLKASGTDALQKAERHIQSKPGQSVAIAFAAGLLARFLLGRRSS